MYLATENDGWWEGVIVFSGGFTRILVGLNRPSPSDREQQPRRVAVLFHIEFPDALWRNPGLLQRDRQLRDHPAMDAQVLTRLNNTLRRRQPRRGFKWHLDEVVARSERVQHNYLMRAVDQNGYTLDILVQSRRDRKAAKRFSRKLHIVRQQELFALPFR